MSIKSRDEISKTLALSKLSKDHDQQMIPTSELLHVLITLIFFDKPIKLRFGEKIRQLTKDVFSLVHGAWTLTDYYFLQS